MSPFAFFEVASFFNRDLFWQAPFRFLGLPHFSSEVFFMSPFVFFWVASFFIGGLFDEPLCIL
jgi:hypothetical protein